MSACACGFDHARLGVEIAGGVLVRMSQSARRVKAFGGAWAFSAAFWDYHRGEFSSVQIVERDSGTVWHTSASAFDTAAIRKTLSAAFGPQIILPLIHWHRLDDTGPGDGAALEQRDAAPVQLILGMSAELQPGEIRFEKARKPRPRIFKSKKPWERGA